MVQNNELYQHPTPLDEQTFQKFLHDEITVKEAKAFKDLVDKRFSYIVHTIAKMQGESVDWFDYDNSDGGEGVGYFDTDSYKDNVEYVGDFRDLPNKEYVKNRFEKYENSFPTKWFYQNFETVLENEHAKFLKKEKEKQTKEKLGKEKAKEDFEKIKDSIKKKLTFEELSYISFLSIDEVKKNQAKHVKIVEQEVAKFIKEMKQKGVDVSKMYQHYRIGKKKPKNFNEWVVKNREGIKNSVKEVPVRVASWPFPTTSGA